MLPTLTPPRMTCLSKETACPKAKSAGVLCLGMQTMTEALETADVREVKTLAGGVEATATIGADGDGRVAGTAADRARELVVVR
jgi:hypothetical protein